ncbi:MAG: anion transporter [Alphaproteobacteria bacterium]|nr:anion transporter [Alphaproteobacteria bacterium]
MPADWIVLSVFGAVYAGMALGGWPGLAVDRTGVALIGAIVLLATGAVTAPQALGSIDFSTLAILFTLMVLSSQYAASGFFDAAVSRLADGERSRHGLLALVIAIAAGLSAVLTNDVVVWAMTPLLVTGLSRRGLDPRPFVIALACAANAGSAATLIGNPQNLLIGETGRLGFWAYTAAAVVPSLLALGVIHAVVSRTASFRRGASESPVPAAVPARPAVDRRALAKAVAATAAILVIFTVADDRGTWALAVAAALLISRREGTRRRLDRVDWPLLLLFASLFVVTGAFAHGSTTARLDAGLAAMVNPGSTGALAAAALAGSNTIGNVPFVMLALSVLPHWSAASLHALALFSTLSGNFLIVGSVANIIAAERAAEQGVHVGFRAYARIGVPVTLASLLIAWAWMALAFPALARLVGP